MANYRKAEGVLEGKFGLLFYKKKTHIKCLIKTLYVGDRRENGQIPMETAMTSYEAFYCLLRRRKKKRIKK